MHSSGAFSSLLLGTLNRRGDTDSFQLEEGICGSNLRVRAGVMAISMSQGGDGVKDSTTLLRQPQKNLYLSANV